MFGSLVQPQILVLGLGETGIAIARWALAQGARVRIADSREAPAARDAVAAQWPEVEIRCGAFGADLLDHAGRPIPVLHEGSPIRELI